MPPQVSDRCFGAQWKRLTDNYLAFADEAVIRGKRDSYAGLMGRNDWIGDAVLVRAVTETLETVAGKLPDVAEFRAICQYAKRALDIEAERAAQDLARPALMGPPAAPQGRWATLTPDQKAAFAERHIAIGKLRYRRGRLLNGGDPHAHEFTEADIAAVVAEMRSGSAPVGPIARDAARVAARAAPNDVPEWPGAAPAATSADGPLEADWRDIPDDPAVRAKPHIPAWTAKQEAALLAKWPHLAKKTDPRKRAWPTREQEQQEAARRERLAARNGVVQ